MNKHLLTAIVVTAIGLLGACTARHRDISSDPSQKPYIGQVCEVVADLRAHGVTRTVERDKKTDYISIWNPGFSGPERTFVVVLPLGTKLQILAARECTNCPFDRLLEYEVKVNPEPAQFEGKPAYLRAESKIPSYMRCFRGDATQPIIPPDSSRQAGEFKR
ncbi:MAG: hypothetical protein WC736_00585 [Gallionella sp.]|jgi:hypothetical protein